ncbi:MULTISPECIES: GSCFA domain-containing protein [Aphanothece]|uniref:GSCFA domain-containing protein n=1 Tax=Aphanothece TaxID=1121 RepID=UPI003984C8FA
MSTNPYEALPASAFWKTGVTQENPCLIDGIYKKKFDILPADKIATAGSCFAQHITRQLKQNGYNIMDVEPPPPGLPLSLHQNYGFSMYSARYGNIYTVRQLLQLTQECAHEWSPKNYIWTKNGRYYDALRPAVEPSGCDAPEVVKKLRKCHIEKVQELLMSLDVFIFTLGLTEMWVHRRSGTVFPTAPGVFCGEYDGAIYRFENASFKSILSDFNKFQDTLRKLRNNRPFKILLTVSPVPLTATASGHHVLVATMHSKAVLLSVASQLSNKQSHIDYFPSYEIVTNPRLHSTSFSDNLRSVRPHAAENAMQHFFREHLPVDTLGLAPHEPSNAVGSIDLEAVQCQEEFIELFAQ